MLVVVDIAGRAELGMVVAQEAVVAVAVAVVAVDCPCGFRMLSDPPWRS